ncbi:MAG: HAMP domain-containing histidine kinase [Burkholderiales bacterium]|nr:MAG: HAMP domain-containing histidine kinase [Burkholderiales bacterium]
MGGLFGRLAVILTALTLGATALLLHFAERSERQNADRVQQALHRDLAANIVADNPLLRQGEFAKGSLENAFHMLMLLGPAFEIYATDTAGAVRAYSAEPGELKTMNIALAPVREFLSGATLPVYGTDPREPGRRKVFSAAPIAGPDGLRRGYLYVIVGGSQQTALERSYAGMLRQDRALLFTLGALLLALLASGLMFGLLTRPLGALNRAMRAFRQGGLARTAIGGPLPGWKSREVSELQQGFVALAETVADQMDRIRSVEAGRRELIAQIAHDLKTPLASQQGYLETWLLQHPDAGDRQHIEVALRNGRQLHRLVEQLLELARLEAGQESLAPEAVAVAELANDVMAEFALEAEQRGVRLAVEARAQGIQAKADIAKLERILANLVDNALRHTDPGGEVRLSIAESDQGVRVEVRDTGVGIASEHLPYVFEPRYRGPGPRVEGAANLGLGLAIARRLLELHGSRIDVDSTLGQGTVFRFELKSA